MIILYILGVMLTILIIIPGVLFWVVAWNNRELFIRKSKRMREKEDQLYVQYLQEERNQIEVDYTEYDKEIDKMYYENGNL